MPLEETIEINFEVHACKSGSKSENVVLRNDQSSVF